MIWPDEIRTSRHVLRDYPAIVAVNALAERKGWALLFEDAADPERGTPYRVEWQTGKSLSLNYAEDDISKSAYIFVAGRFPDKVQELESSVLEEFHPLTVADLIQAVGDARSGPERARALVRLGLGSPAEFAADVFERIVDGMRDTEPMVRNTAVFATTFSPWPQYRPELRQLAADDPDEGVRTSAEGALRLYDEGGVPDDE